MPKWKHSLPFLLVFAVFALLVVPPVAAQGGEILEVTITDSEVTSGGCDTDCSFLDALTASNSMAGVQEIHFNIPGGGVQTIIAPSIGFQIQSSVIVDATTQPGYSGTPLIQIQPTTVSAQAIAVSGNSSTFDPGLSATIRGFAVNGFTSGVGICLCNGQNNLVEKNFIGVNPAGTAAAPNDTGIFVVARNSVIRDNVISGNTNTGLYISSNATRLSLNNIIAGNFIGTDLTGTVAIPNRDGIAVRSGANNNTIGGTTPADRNIISGNLQWGIFTVGNDSNPTSNTNSTTIVGNYIGTDVTGTLNLGNHTIGILIQSSDSNVIGGTTGVTLDGSCTGACNLISGNGIFGVQILEDSGGTSENNLIQGNFIGTDVTGTLPLGNVEAGVNINSSHNTVGGTAPEALNVISANGHNGIQLASGAHENNILGNNIGTDTTGYNELGNDDSGIFLSADSYGNNIGDGTEDGANWIGYNGFSNDRGGVSMTGNSANRNRITGNSFFENYGLGIDLNRDGVTLNDPQDADVGPNGYQNFPVITSILIRATTLAIGTLNSLPNHPYKLEFYANVYCEDSGYGEGDVFVGSGSVTTDANGNAAFQIPVDLPAAYALVTGLAIDEDTAPNSPTRSNTSEFSECQSASTDLSITNTDSVDPATPGNPLTYTLTVTNSNAAGASYAVNTALTDYLPEGVTYVLATPSQGTCDYEVDVHILNCDLGDIPNGAAVTVTVDTTVNADITTSPMENAVTVISETFETNFDNNLAVQNTAIVQSNLRLTMTDLPDPVTVDAFLTYNLTVTNLGLNNVAGVKLNDTLPINATVISVTPSQGTCTPGTGTLACDLGTLNNGASATVLIVVRPDTAAQNTNISNRATVSGLVYDPFPANNTVVVTTRVNPSTGVPFINLYETSQPVLTWNAVSGAVRYDVQVDDDKAFNSINFEANNIPASDQFVTTSVLHDGPWYWRVRAQVNGVWGAWSPVTSFVVDVP